MGRAGRGEGEQRPPPLEPHFRASEHGPPVFFLSFFLAFALAEPALPLSSSLSLLSSLFYPSPSKRDQGPPPAYLWGDPSDSDSEPCAHLVCALSSFPLLPPHPTPRQVVLDLDETLVAVYPSPAPASARASAPCITVTADYGDGSAGPVDVFIRPGLDAFLTRLSTLPVDVVMFTAGAC